jgi:hypothetical protein
MEQKQTGWVGVDFDGTLSKFGKSNPDELGEPVPRMVERVKAMLAAGVEVRIVTARAQMPGRGPVPELDLVQISGIHAWCLKHIGRTVPVQFWKDYAMRELWDDRAVSVVMNEGVSTAEVALHPLEVAGEIYRLAMSTKGHLPKDAVYDLGRALGFPEPDEAEPSRIIRPGR